MMLRTALAWLALLLVPQFAHAAITCSSVTSPGGTIAYANSTTAVVATQFFVTCSRGSLADPSTLNYLLKPNDGLNPTTASRNQVSNGAATLIYDTYIDSSCGTQWGAPTAFGGLFNWGATTGPLTDARTFYICIKTPQVATVSGTYTDTVKLTLTYGGSTLTSNFPVTVYAPASCTVSVPDFNLAYTAFAPSQSSLTQSYTVNCTAGMPYSIALSPTSGTLLGLDYTVSHTGSSASGTGTPTSYGMTVTIAARQAGTCAGSTCTASASHTITVTY